MWDFRYCKLNFQGFWIFKNFYLKYFQKWEALFQNKKKIRLDKYFVILSWKCAPVGKIKSFTVTSGLRISKFRTVCPNEWVLDFGKPCQFEKRASKIFFKGHFSARETNFRGATKLSWLVFIHHFDFRPKQFFWTIWKFDPKYYLLRIFEKLEFLKTLWPKNYSNQVFLRDFSGILEFPKMLYIE